MDCSTPVFPVLHHLPMLTQTHVYWVGNTIQPSRPLSPPSSAFNLFQHHGLFQWVSSHIRWPKYWSFSISPFNEYSGLVSFRIDWFDLLALPTDSEESSSTPQFKSISSSALSLLYDPTLTSIHDYWKNHSFDYTDLCWQSNVSMVFPVAVYGCESSTIKKAERQR